MTLGRTKGVSLQGLLGSVIDIEVDIADGIPIYSLLGLPDTSLQESRDRVRAAGVGSHHVNYLRGSCHEASQQKGSTSGTSSR